MDAFLDSLDAVRETPQWVNDGDATGCMVCDKKFSLLVRRHHCRSCGGVFCDQCCDKRRTLTHLNINSPVRVCDPCFLELRTTHPENKLKTSLGEILEKDSRGYPLKKPPFGIWKDNALWNSASVGKLVSIYDTRITTVHDIFEVSATKFANQRGCGTRCVVGVESPGTPQERARLGAYEWTTYADRHQRASRFASGLILSTDIKPQESLVLCAQTQEDWMTIVMGCFQHAITVVTVYTSLTSDALSAAINQNKSSVVIVDTDLLPTLAKIAPQCPTLRFVITLQKGTNNANSTNNPFSTSFAQSIEQTLAHQQLTSTTPNADSNNTGTNTTNGGGGGGVSVFSVQELVERGRVQSVSCGRVPLARDTAVVMYTSGTTGTPKGVRLSHENIVASVAGIRHFLGHVAQDFAETYIAYLPLAHIMEFITEIAVINEGAAIGYATPQTLTTPPPSKTTSSNANNISNEVGDLVALSPSIIVFPPIVLEKLYNAVRTKISRLSPFKRWLFGKALEAGMTNLDRGQIGAPPFWNKLVFKSLQEIAGGKLRIILVGSAPLAPQVQRFIQVIFNCPVRQGYGCTETSGVSFVQEISDNTTGVVGPPRVCCCMKLVDWEEGGFRLSDEQNPHIRMKRGEVVVGGKCVAQGYATQSNSTHNRNAVQESDNSKPLSPTDAGFLKSRSTSGGFETANEDADEGDFFVDENGVRWFRTGDIGAILPDGSLQLIDRKKDFVKLQHGEYVSVTKVENILRTCPLVDNVMVHATPSQPYCTALICPVVSELKDLAVQLQLPQTNTPNDIDRLCANKTVIDAMLRILTETANGTLMEVEMPQRILLVPPSRTWSEQNGTLTAGLKLKRKAIVRAHLAELMALYAPTSARR